MKRMRYTKVFALILTMIMLIQVIGITPVMAQSNESEENPLNTLGRTRFTFEDGTTLHHSGGTIETVFTYYMGISFEQLYFYKITVYLHGSDGTELKAVGWLDNTNAHNSDEFKGAAAIRIPVDTDALHLPAEAVTLKCSFQIEKVLSGECSETGRDEVVERSDMRECGMELHFGEPCGMFEDIDRESWYHAGVDFVSSMGIMRGVSEHSFAPNDLMTRGMLVTVLWRKQGMPETGWNPFSDVPEDAYYAKAVAWARKEGIIYGYSKTEFGPNDPVTREQLATIIGRYCNVDRTWALTATRSGRTEQTVRGADLSIWYDDADQVADYAVGALYFLTDHGIINGVAERTLDPKGFATRAQVATILQRYESYYIVFRIGF